MTLLRETDYGTPKRPGPADVELTVDGIPVAVPAGTSVMRAAMDAGVAVPKLCATDSLAAFGSCRLCVVEIDGVRGTPASCTTPVAPGMAVHTQTPRVEKLRREDSLFDAFTSWTTDRGLTLYPAQEEALMEIVAGSNVILATPTSVSRRSTWPTSTR